MISLMRRDLGGSRETFVKVQEGHNVSNNINTRRSVGTKKDHGIYRVSNHEIFKETQVANIEGKGRMS
jgi:hypothetical protein